MTKPSMMMMKMNAVCLVVLLAMTMTGAVGAVDVVLPVLDDTYIFSYDEEGVSNEGEEFLLVGNVDPMLGADIEPAMAHALLRFDDTEGVIPLNAVIQSAELRVGYLDIPFNDEEGQPVILNPTVDISIHRVTTEWPSVGTTWYLPWNTPGGDFESMATDTVTFVPLGDYVERVGIWDVTKDVQAILADPSSNFGWILKGETGLADSYVFLFVSKDVTEDWFTTAPELVISYTTSSTPTTNPPAAVATKTSKMAKAPTKNSQKKIPKATKGAK